MRDDARITVRTRPTPTMYPKKKDVITSKTVFWGVSRQTFPRIPATALVWLLLLFCHHPKFGVLKKSGGKLTWILAHTFQQENSEKVNTFSKFPLLKLNTHVSILSATIPFRDAQQYGRTDGLHCALYGC